MSAAIADRIDAVVDRLRAQLPRDWVAPVGIVLGSGLGALGDRIAATGVALPYEALGLPTSTVAGHAGRLCCGMLSSVPVLCLQGRVHLYEGHALESVVLPVRSLARWGVKTMVLTNAAGGVNPALEPGDLMMLTDHLNLLGDNPLVGPNLEGFGPRFPDMTEPYDAQLRLAFHAVAASMGDVLPRGLRDGVYAALRGPSYETPAEIRMLSRLGADAVGMSTVPEVIALRHMGVRCVAISCITNKAAGLGSGALDHAEVQQVGERMRGALSQLISGAVAKLVSSTEAM